jgi:hypothetical protein
VGGRNVAARRIVYDGELPKDIAWVQKGEDCFALVRRHRRDLHDAHLQQENLVARIAHRIDALAALDLEHARHLLHLCFLRRRQGVQEPEVLQIGPDSSRRQKPDRSPIANSSLVSSGNANSGPIPRGSLAIDYKRLEIL